LFSLSLKAVTIKNLNDINYLLYYNDDKIRSGCWMTSEKQHAPPREWLSDPGLTLLAFHFET